MRRSIIYPFVAVLTFAIGITASLLLNSLRALSTIKTNSPSLMVSVEPPPKPALNAPVVANCGCHVQASGFGAPSPEPYGDKPPINGGVLNGKALILQEPVYPAIAKAAHASGKVSVQITIDEWGCVVSARAVGGHPLLQAAAVQAARRSCFSPTRLSGVAVKVTGIIVYNFVLS